MAAGLLFSRWLLMELGESIVHHADLIKAVVHAQFQSSSTCTPKKP